MQSTPEWSDGLLTPRGATLNTKPGARGCSSSLSQDASALGAGRMEVNSGPSGSGPCSRERLANVNAFLGIESVLLLSLLLLLLKLLQLLFTVLTCERSCEHIPANMVLRMWGPLRL